MDEKKENNEQELTEGLKQELRHWKMWLGLDPDEEIHLTEEEEKIKQGFLEFTMKEQQRIREERRRREAEAQEQEPESGE